MSQLPMVDLVSQYDHIKEEIGLSFQEILSTGAFIGGKYVNQISRDLESYLDVNHVIPCGNGTDAIQIALMALGLRPGDEVITTAFTFVATVEVIALLGMKPVFVDIDPKTFNIDASQLEQAITAKTKCIIPVHLFGLVANMDEIMDIANRHNLFVIEDTAQAIGGDYTGKNNGKAGTIGHIGTTSFFPSKNLGCYGDGGAIFTNDEALSKKCRSICNHGSSVRYYHDDLGVNSRLDNLQAAVLCAKLKKLDSYTQNRQRAAAFYTKELSGLSQIVCPNDASQNDHVFHQYTMRVENRDALSEHLKSAGIANAVYYPVPLHLQKAYKEYGSQEGDLPHTEQACREVLSLPMHSELREETQKIIINAIKAFYA